jgi:hypothetical protein
MLVIHFWNEIPNVTVYITVSRVDGDSPKKIIRLSLKEGVVPGTIVHAEKLLPKQKCRVSFEDLGSEIDLQDAAGFIIGYARVGEHEGIFRLQGFRQ